MTEATAPAPTTTATPATDTAAPAASPTPNTAATSTPAGDAPAAVGTDAAPAATGGEPNSEGTPPAQDGDKPADANKADNASSDSSDGKQPDGKDQEGQTKEGEVSAEQYQEDLKTNLKLPEGMEIDEEAFKAAAPVFHKIKASAEDANALANVAASMVSKAVKTMQEQHDGMVKGWRAETEKAHGDGGEAAYMQRVGIAQEAIDKFFDADGKKSLEQYGFGNHPAFFRMALTLGQLMRDDGFTLPTGAAISDKGEQTLDQVWYPEAGKKD
jgi:hypothetical protein